MVLIELETLYAEQIICAAVGGKQEVIVSTEDLRHSRGFNAYTDPDGEGTTCGYSVGWNSGGGEGEGGLYQQDQTGKEMHLWI